ncbi:MAG: hypothetical protein KDN20_02415 [Verrucomicrobiae bacterium]|nr:hypothetical protein [Verrucomicrobiae bacterium]
MNKKTLLVLGGALLGGVVGYLVFSWLVRNSGAYGFAIPGVLVGLGASFYRGAPTWATILCGVIGLGFGVFSIWKMAPFIADGSFGYFVSHLHHLPTIQLILLSLGTGVAFWLPFARRAR